VYHVLEATVAYATLICTFYYHYYYYYIEAPDPQLPVQLESITTLSLVWYQIVPLAYL